VHEAISASMAQSRIARFFSVQDAKAGKNIPNVPKMHKKAKKCTGWPSNRQNCHKKYQHFPFKTLKNLPKLGFLV
jgi:hypothetical protein